MPDDTTTAATCQEVAALTRAKIMTYRLSTLYEMAGMPDEARKITYCSTYPSFGVSDTGRRRLISNNSCRLRLCPVCTERRAHNTMAELSRVMDYVATERPNVTYLFLTLTVANPRASALRPTLQHLTRAWTKLIKHRAITRAIGGWYRALEITRTHDGERWDEYHPHIHAILAVGPEYFDRTTGLYLTHDAWLDHWQQALDVSYRPGAHIERIYADNTQSGTDTASRDAAMEAAKYATKTGDYITTRLPIDQAAAVVRTYSAALKGQRLHAYGGWLADAARELGTEETMARLDQDRALRGDVIRLIEDYHWSFGARDYVLDRVYTQPQPPAPPPAPAPADAIAPADTPEQLEIEGMPAPQTRRPV